MAKGDNVRMFRPNSEFVAGTRVPTEVRHYIWVKDRGRPLVVCRDGFIMISDYTLTELINSGEVVEVDHV